MLQAISYATLANVPVVNGIYTAILPGAAYVVFGTSMHLGLGPVALVSILTGQLVLNYGIAPGSQEAVNFTSEAALAVGTIFAVLSIFNLGDLITYISHPVMVRSLRLYMMILSCVNLSFHYYIF